MPRRKSSGRPRRASNSVNRMIRKLMGLHLLMKAGGQVNPELAAMLRGLRSFNRTKRVTRMVEDLFDGRDSRITAEARDYLRRLG